MDSSASNEVTLTLLRVRRRVWQSTLTVVALGGLAELLRWLGQLHVRSDIVAFLSLSYEQNLPTFYASAQLAVCAGLLWLVAQGARREGGRHVWYWRVLALGFALMALDEVAELHERSGQWLALPGVLYFSWVVPAAVLVTLIGVAYIPFLRALAARLRNQLLFAGATYLSGAVLMELPLGYWTERHGSANAGYALIDWLEESLEFAGITLFLVTLVGVLVRQRALLRFASEEPAAGREAR